MLEDHKTTDPVGSTYAGLVSRESVRIAFTYTAINGLDVFAADIRNAYLQTPSSQKEFIICDVEFGLENIRKVSLIHCALYCGKKAGSDFRNHPGSCMRHIDFTYCLANLFVWMRLVKKIDGTSYYEYILLYNDNAYGVIPHADETLRKDLGRYFDFKEESIVTSKIYLGGNCRRVQLENGVKAWDFS